MPNMAETRTLAGASYARFTYGQRDASEDVMSVRSAVSRISGIINFVALAEVTAHGDGLRPKPGQYGIQSRTQLRAASRRVANYEIASISYNSPLEVILIINGAVSATGSAAWATIRLYERFHVARAKVARENRNRATEELVLRELKLYESRRGGTREDQQFERQVIKSALSVAFAADLTIDQA